METRIIVVLVILAATVVMLVLDVVCIDIVLIDKQLISKNDKTKDLHPRHSLQLGIRFKLSQEDLFD
ncbi:MAG: hypothetical protein KG029_00465 [Bacteroidetes bacterium]|nr:hypothetical protein [Bacteroidota bacterium]